MERKNKGFIATNPKLAIFIMFMLFALITTISSIIVAYTAKKEVLDVLFPVLTGWAGMLIGFVIKAAADFGLDGTPDDEKQE